MRKGLLLWSGVRGMLVDRSMEMSKGGLRRERGEKEKGENAKGRG